MDAGNSRVEAELLNRLVDGNDSLVACLADCKRSGVVSRVRFLHISERVEHAPQALGEAG